ncbi:hypothetical protein [Noviherbaspirillum aerium]|uniref:hypothetical protein n=1 Tax=Noviherbaspirillum aerium TaxID=2588497 RepID=UPI00124C86B3|nr:hypothetical protein [Noviherbaspirillum aerium]
MDQTQANVEKIKELALKLRDEGLATGLNHGDVTIALGFAAKLLVAEAFASKKQSVSEEQAYEMAKGALIFGFNQNIQVVPTDSGSHSLEPGKAH